MVFSIGRGILLGNLIVLVIKIIGNKIIFVNMEDNMDFDVSLVIYGL